MICATLLQTWYWAALLSALTTFSVWSIHLISIELEMPFGDDPDDLPLYEMQQSMNESLKTLLEPQAQTPPAFKVERSDLGSTVQKVGSADNFFDLPKVREKRSLSGKSDF